MKKIQKRKGGICGFICNYVISYVESWLKTFRGNEKVQI